MKHTRKLTVLSIVLLFSLFSSIVFPTRVLADEPTPPPAETSEVQPPAEEPVSTQEPVITDEPVPTQLPSRQRP